MLGRWLEERVWKFGVAMDGATNISLAEFRSLPEQEKNTPTAEWREDLLMNTQDAFDEYKEQVTDQNDQDLQDFQKKAADDCNKLYAEWAKGKPYGGSTIPIEVPKPKCDDNMVPAATDDSNSGFSSPSLAADSNLFESSESSEFERTPPSRPARNTKRVRRDRSGTALPALDVNNDDTKDANDNHNAGAFDTKGDVGVTFMNNPNNQTEGTSSELQDTSINPESDDDVRSMGDTKRSQQTIVDLDADDHDDDMGVANDIANLDSGGNGDEPASPRTYRIGSRWLDVMVARDHSGSPPSFLAASKVSKGIYDMTPGLVLFQVTQALPQVGVMGRSVAGP